VYCRCGSARRWERIANRSLHIEIAYAPAASERWSDNPSWPVGEGGNTGRRLSSQKSGQNIVSIFFIGAENSLFDGDEVPIAKTRCGCDLASLREPCLVGRHIDQDFIADRRNEFQAFAGEIMLISEPFCRNS